MNEFAARAHGELPQQIQTFAGDVVYPHDDRWAFRADGTTFSFNFEKIPTLARELVLSWKKVLIWYLQNKSAHHANSAFHRVLHLIRFLAEGRCDPIREIAPSDILNYRGVLPPKRGWYLGSVSGFLCRWSDLGYSGVPAETARLLRNLRLPGNEKGEAVRTSDPFEGPLTDIEFVGLMSALNDALANKVISEEDYLAVWLTACLGLRPLQISELKIKDLHEPQAAKGGQWTLDVPRLKQRGTAARSQMKHRPITQTIGEMRHLQAAQVQLRFDKQEQALPIFPATRVTVWLAGYEWHRSANSIRLAIKSVAQDLCVFSERTGEPLSITPRRLRRSFGTRAASEGAGEYEVAELLDHSDTQNSKVYTEATYEIIERLDKAVALKLAPFAQAFTGHFAAAEELHTAPGGIVRGGVQAPPLGACGQNAFCGFAAPIACYTCRQFRPWRDGPHAAVLEKLISERERLQSTTDSRIAGINDRTILAVAEVVHKSQDGSYNGVIKTLTLNVKAAQFRVSEKENDRAPDYRIFVGETEIGAAWKKISRDNRHYLSVKLDDPTFPAPAPVYASLVDADEGCSLIWSRSRLAD
jgi:uncharacterized protein (DUF736 family)/integrase